MKKRHILILAWFSVTLVLGGGCSSSIFFSDPIEWSTSTVVVRYHPDSLRNYQVARDFAAVGRFELAREHYLLALATANDPGLRDALAFELDSINLMIKTLR
jgi:hypothetical protein